MGKNQFELLFPAAAAVEKAVLACQNEPPLTLGSRYGSHSIDKFSKMVGRTGFEPVTSSVSGCRPGAFDGATEPLTCWLTWRGPGDSPVFTPLALAVLGPM